MKITNDSYPKVNNQLEETGRLVFMFPNPDGGANTYRTCPFFENPVIKESQSANLVQYQPIGRAGTLFGYTGAASRMFDVSFKVTLPLLVQLSQSIAYKNDRPAELSKEEQARSFFVDGGSDAAFNAEVDSTRFGRYREDFLVDRIVLGDALTSEGEQLKKMYGNSLGFPGHNPKGVYADVINLMLYWATLIRSSVTTYAPNPSVGPPIVRLTFGILYQDVPTIASKYSITVDESAGYDVVSLMPRRFSINLTLNEVRESGINQFEQGEPLTRDQLVGWEQVVGRTPRPTLDPGRS